LGRLGVLEQFIEPFKSLFKTSFFKEVFITLGYFIVSLSEVIIILSTLYLNDFQLIEKKENHLIMGNQGSALVRFSSSVEMLLPV
jgi:hypothetical protein